MSEEQRFPRDELAEAIKAAWFAAVERDMTQWCDDHSIDGDTDFFAYEAAKAVMKTEAS